MPFTVQSYAVTSPTSPLAPYALKRRDVASNDVRIDILYAGMCRCDLYLARFHMKGVNYPVYPLVPGHQIVGRVSGVGPDVKHTQVGDVVAVGPLVDSCGKCTFCKKSQEMLCASGPTTTYNEPERRWPGHSTAGGYSEVIVVQEHFVLKVPKSLQKNSLFLGGVAPLLCAGMTVYLPLVQGKVGRGSKVAIVGLGRLGGLGVQIAHALGAEVTLVSRTHEKDKMAKGLGAQAVIASSSAQELAAKKGYFDVVVHTVPRSAESARAEHRYIDLLKPYGTICYVQDRTPFVNFKRLPVTHITEPCIIDTKYVTGAEFGGIKDTQKLLDLCGEHDIICPHAPIKMQDVNVVWQAMILGYTRMAFVIDIGAFRQATRRAA